MDAQALSKSGSRSRSTDLIETMADASFYGAPAGPVDRRETHISWVFLVGDCAYKLKKPVVFPFLDYGTADRRREMCELELKLNRRLASEVYLRVLPVVTADGGFVLGDRDGGEVVDWTLEMRRFREERTLEGLLELGELGPQELTAVARRLARFHSECTLAPRRAWKPSYMREVIDRDLETLWSLATEIEDGWYSRQLAATERFLLAFRAGHYDLLRERGTSGRVRDGHGDLRLEHVVIEEGVQIVDCVEFDADLRYVDVGDDLAFLVMDFVSHGEDDLGWALVDAYREAGGDPGSDSLVAYWAAYRGLIRAKIALLRAAEAETPGERATALDDATHYFEVTRRLRWRARCPLTIVVRDDDAGAAARFAEAMADASGFPLARSGDTSSAGLEWEQADSLGLVVHASRGPAEPSAAARRVDVVVDSDRDVDAIVDDVEALLDGRLAQDASPAAVVSR